MGELAKHPASEDRVADSDAVQGGEVPRSHSVKGPLPHCSIALLRLKILQQIEVKEYKDGEYIVRQGEIGL